MDIDRLKQKAHMENSQWANVSGPSAKDISDIESEDPGTGIYTPEQIEGLRRMNESIDPAYARQRAARRKVTGGVQPRLDVETALSRVRGGAGTSGTSDKALTTLEGAFGTSNKKGEVAGVMGGGAEMGSSGDEPVSSPPMRASGLADVGGAPSGYYGRNKDTAKYQQGVFLLRTAGRCNHPRCQMLRAKGMELIHGEKRYQTGGQYWESQETPIPSIATEKPYYPTVGGKEDRKNKQTYIDLSPADTKNPEWVAATTAAKSGSSIFEPSDLLEHHHRPGDEDFERYPLPF